MKRLLQGYLLAAAASLLSACGSGGVGDSAADQACLDLCKKGQDLKCSGMPADCNAACAKVATLNSNSSCDDEYKAFAGCVNGATVTSCDDKVTKCSSQINTYGFCIAPYCLKNPTPSECSATF